jgi:hypothetical protein
MPDQRLQPRRARDRRVRINPQAPPQPRDVLSPEALSRLAQQIARILQRLRAEGPGGVKRVRGG